MKRTKPAGGNLHEGRETESCYRRLIVRQNKMPGLGVPWAGCPQTTLSGLPEVMGGGKCTVLKKIARLDFRLSLRGSMIDEKSPAPRRRLMPRLGFHFIFALGCVLALAGFELLFEKFARFFFDDLGFLSLLWYQFNFVPHTCAVLFGQSASWIGSPLFWKVAIMEWFIWGVVLSFVFEGFRVRGDVPPICAQYRRELILLAPCALPLILLGLRSELFYSGFFARILGYVAMTVAYLSPLLALYSIAIMIAFARRKNPVWIKIIEVLVAFLAANLLINLSAFYIGMLLGFEMFPHPS
jgi:hypothetical protein